MNRPLIRALCAEIFILSALGRTLAAAPADTIPARIASRDYPAVFQAWNPIDMPARFPLATFEDRLQAAAKHDLIWEEPGSAPDFGANRGLGAVWDNPHIGLAEKFTDASLKRALANRHKMLQLNSHMVFLCEERWRDAPDTYLPAESKFWKRHADGQRVTGWDGGSRPFYMLDCDSPAFQDHVARQCKYAVESGVYDGVMLDWSGHLEIIKKVRAAIGNAALIIVNIHDDIKAGEKYQSYINGSFMECNPAGPGQPPGGGNGTTWESARAALKWFEANLRAPRINCLEVWGDRGDQRRMRATTTLGLVYSEGFVLYADPNPLPTPDHLHDWYPLWNIKLGRPHGPAVERAGGAASREFAAGDAVYNQLGNAPAKITFAAPRKRVSDGSVGTEFTVADADGDVFLNDTNATVEVSAMAADAGRRGHRAPEWAGTTNFSNAVGAASHSTMASLSPGDLEVTQTGGWGIWNTNDVCSFTWFKQDGDFDVRVRVASLKFASPWTKAGLMARQNLTPESAHVSAMIQAGLDGDAKPGSAMRPVCPQRQTSGGESSFMYDYSEETAPSGPVWLRLVRAGADFSSYFSVDGREWTKYGSERREDLAGSLYLGLATASTGEKETTACYEQFSFAPSVP